MAPLKHVALTDDETGEKVSLDDLLDMYSSKQAEKQQEQFEKLLDAKLEVLVDSKIEKALAPVSQSWERLVKESRAALPDGVRSALLIVCISAPCLLLPTCVYATSVSKIGRDVDQDASISAVRQYRHLQMCYFATVFWTGASTTIVIPAAKDVAENLGQGAAYAGFLIGAPWLLVAMANLWLLRHFSYSSRRLILLICTVGFVVSLTICAVGVQPPELFDITNSTRALILLGGRVAMGFFDFGSSLLLILIQKMAPQDHAGTLQICRTAVSQVGMGAGPFLSSLIGDVAGVTEANGRMALGLLVLALAWSVHFVILWISLPSELEPELKATQETEPAWSRDRARHEQAVDAAAQLLQRSDRLLCSQKVIWIACFCIGLARNFMVPALEAASACIFEVEFGLSISDIGLVLGASFTSVTLFVPMCVLLRRKSSFSDVDMLSVLSIAMIFSVLLLRYGDQYWMICLADAAISSTAYVCAAIADGLANQNSAVGSCFSQETYFLYTMFFRVAAAGVFAPAVAELLLSAGGREIYADFQMGLCVALSTAVWTIAAAMVWMPHFHQLAAAIVWMVALTAAAMVWMNA